MFVLPELELVSVVEAGGGLLQVTANLLAIEGQAGSGGTPFAEGVVKMLAADADPVALKLAGQMLNLWLQLAGNLLIELHKKCAKLTHQVGIYMNCSHGRILLQNGARIKRELGLIDLFEAGGCILQVATNFFTSLDDALGG